jgi:hypothetical protein
MVNQYIIANDDPRERLPDKHRVKLNGNSEYVTVCAEKVKVVS